MDDRAFSLADLYRATATARPQTRFLVVPGDPEAAPSSVTLADVLDRGPRLAASLALRGLGHGDTLALQMPHCSELAICAVAAADLGAALMTLPPSWGPAETGFALRQSRARLLITGSAWRGRDCREMIAAAGPLPGLESHLAIGDDAAHAMALRWEDLWSGHPHASPAAPTPPDQPAFILYSSGTTSDPKGILHPPFPLADKARSIIELEHRDQDAVSLALWPAGTVGSIFYLMRFFQGQHTALMQEWSAPAAARAIDRLGADFVAGTPLHLGELLDAAAQLDLGLNSLRAFQCGGAPVPSALVKRAERHGIVLFRSYGATEYPCASYGSVRDSLESRVATEGSPAPGAEFRFVDDEDRDVAQGESGEILLRGPHRFMGYADPALDDAALTRDGWYRTGDVGMLSGDGRLVLTGRKKDIIIRGGENISVKEIEDALLDHPAIAEVAVIGTPHQRFGEIACAVVVLAPGCAVDLGEIDAHFRKRGLSRRKTPERLEIVDRLPRNLLGKVLKRELQERYALET